MGQIQVIFMTTKLKSTIILASLILSGASGSANEILPKELATLADTPSEICENIVAPLPALKDIPKEKIMIEAGDLVITYDSQVFWKEQFVPIKGGVSPNRERVRKKNSVILMRLLISLVERRGKYVFGQELFDEVWVHMDEKGQKDGADPLNNVRQGISTLRDSFLKVDPTFDRIKIHRKIGYAWDSGERKGAITIGDLWIHKEMLEVAWKNSIVPLGPSEFNFVVALATKPGQIIPIERLYALMGTIAMGKREEVENFRNSMYTRTSKIRSKFRQVDPLFDKIHNHQDEGYSWDSPK